MIRNHFDTLLSRYPAGLSRDAMLLIALQRRYKTKEKERREARAILMERRDIEPGCPVPQRSPEIPPDKDY